MKNTALSKQLNALESEFQHMSDALVQGDAEALQVAAARLQQMAQTLLALQQGGAGGAGGAGAASERADCRQRLERLAGTLPSLRDGLLRRAVLTERMLQIVLPAAPAPSTYDGHATYGKSLRQSGTLRGLSV